MPQKNSDQFEQLGTKIDPAMAEVKSIHAIEAEFSDWLAGISKATRVMKAVVYDQYGHDAWPVMGTREEILGQYHFYRDCYPEKSLGLVSEEYYKHKKSLL